MWQVIDSSGHILYSTSSGGIGGTVSSPYVPYASGANTLSNTATTKTQVEYLSAATGTTGTTSASLVFSASPTLTGNPLAPTQAPGDNSTKIATTAFVTAAVAAGGGTAGGDLAGTYPNPTVYQAHLTDQALPSTPAAGTLTIYSFNQNGFSTEHALDSTGLDLEQTRDNLTVVRNTSGASIAKGSAVYITGATGTIPTVAKAKADSLTTLPAIGLMIETTANNAFGRCMVLGAVEQYDTSAFTAGDKLYVSATTAGAITNAAPPAGNYVQQIGGVLTSGVGNGSIFVKPSATLGYTNASGMLKGSSNQIAQATSGTDYSAGTSALATGILKSTTGTGALTIAVAGDFPTLNQNTTGSAASLSISGQTGLLTFTGLTSTNRIKTVRDAADTILELGGSYTPTGTWTNMSLTTPTIASFSNATHNHQNAAGGGTLDLTAIGGSTVLPIANGGTAGTTAASARSSLGTIYTTRAQFTLPSSPADSTTYYAGSSTPTTSTSSSFYKVYVPYARTLIGYSIEATNTASTATSETSTVFIRQNDTSNTTLSSTVAFNGAPPIANGYYGASLSVSFAAGDYYCLGWTTPAWATNPTGAQMQITLYWV